MGLANALRVLLDHVPVVDEGQRQVVLGAADDLDKQEREAHPYEEWKVAELKDEVTQRNTGRDDDTQIFPASARKDDLVAALYDDDAREEAGNA